MGSVEDAARRLLSIREHLGKIFTVVAALALLLPDFFDGSGFNRPWWWWFAAVVGIVLWIAALISDVTLRPSRSDLLAEEDRLRAETSSFREQADRRDKELRRAIEAIARRLLKHLDVHPATVRLSVYYHLDKEFVLVARASDNPELEKSGRRSYPDTQGVIARAWQERRFVVTDLPEDPDEWISACASFNMSADVAAAVTMKSRCYLGLRLEHGTTDRVGVVIVESLSKNAVTADVADSFEKGDDILSQLMTTLTEVVYVFRGSFDQ